jgi:4-amino-4-deoxy-L-arabinose transferase-like glycosyltransferase
MTPMIWLGLLAALALITRPPLPVDETRYLSVAWEMWHTGNFQVPHLNGLPYSDKPPLLFWLIQLGWAAFGVGEWWPRLVPAFFSAASLGVISAIARRIGPGVRWGVEAVPCILAGLLLWVVFSVALMFDLVLAFFVMVAILGLVRAVRGERWGWSLVALGLAAGLLTKGPVVLLHVAGPALLAPWWGRGLRGERPLGARFYAAFGAALLAGLALAGTWALPAAFAGGEEYRRAILLDQTAGRVVHSFAHQRPWYWYFPLLPAVLFPFFFWPPLWRALGRLRGSGASSSPVVRLALAWTVPPFLSFLAISGKQPHYLLPLLPPIALLVAYLLERAPAARGRDLAGPLIPAGIVAIGLLLARELPSWISAPAWLGQVAPGAGLLAALALTGAALFLARDLTTAGVRLGLVSVVLVAGLLVAFSPVVDAAYDVRETAVYMGVLERQGRPLARVRNNEGEFNFAGRLVHPMEIIPTGTIDAWLAANPTGAVIEETKEVLPPERLGGATLVVPYRTKQLVVWERRQ